MLSQSGTVHLLEAALQLAKAYPSCEIRDIGGDGALGIEGKPRVLTKAALRRRRAVLNEKSPRHRERNRGPNVFLHLGYRLQQGAVKSSVGDARRAARGGAAAIKDPRPL